jgi:hypothetical protein
MNKKTWILIFIIPNLRSLATWLRMRDDNDTGPDNELASAADHFIGRLEKYATSE